MHLWMHPLPCMYQQPPQPYHIRHIGMCSNAHDLQPRISSASSAYTLHMMDYLIRSHGDCELHHLGQGYYLLVRRSPVGYAVHDTLIDANASSCCMPLPAAAQQLCQGQIKRTLFCMGSCVTPFHPQWPPSFSALAFAFAALLCHSPSTRLSDRACLKSVTGQGTSS